MIATKIDGMSPVLFKKKTAENRNWGTDIEAGYYNYLKLKS